MGKKNKISSVWKAPGCLDVVIRNKVEYLESGAAVQQADGSSEGRQDKEAPAGKELEGSEGSVEATLSCYPASPKLSSAQSSCTLVYNHESSMVDLCHGVCKQKPVYAFLGSRTLVFL